jgi:4-hydroxybenzoate polyprenyltransferase
LGAALRALLGLLRTMRPKQWTKNLLFVFPPIIFDGQLFVPSSFLRVVAAFVALCLISGTVYIINDLADIESDRKHPRKQFRPLPSGQVPIRLALIAAVLIPAITLTLSFLLSVQLTVVLIIYLVLQLIYTFRLKHVVLVDVLVITAGFVLRVVAGAVVIDVRNFSPWLYVVLGLLALFLAISKRRQELILLGPNAGDIRPIFRYYNISLLDEMLRMVTTSTLITFMLYTIETTSQFRNLGLLTVPFVVYGLFRYLYLIYVMGEVSPPDEVLLKDRPLQIAIGLFALFALGIIYVAGRV